jgi:hypothetical protein
MQRNRLQSPLAGRFPPRGLRSPSKAEKALWHLKPVAFHGVVADDETYEGAGKLINITVSPTNCWDIAIVTKYERVLTVFF